MATLSKGLAVFVQKVGEVKAVVNFIVYKCNSGFFANINAKSFVSSESEKYLPQVMESPAFKLSREKLKQGETLHRLKR